MRSVNSSQPTGIFPLLAGGLDVGRRIMLAETGAEAHGLRGSHLRVLTVIPREGIRPTALATLVGMTKQSMGEFVAALENAGYVRVSADPQDGRARVVTPTPSGEKLQDRIALIFADTQARWEREVGPRQWATFLKVLRHLQAEQVARRDEAS